MRNRVMKDQEWDRVLELSAKKLKDMTPEDTKELAFLGQVIFSTPEDFKRGHFRGRPECAQHKAIMGEENRRRLRAYMSKNGYTSMIECAEAHGMGTYSLSRVSQRRLIGRRMKEEIKQAMGIDLYTVEDLDRVMVLSWQAEHLAKYRAGGREYALSVDVTKI